MDKNDENTDYAILNSLKTAKVASLLATVFMIIGTVVILIIDNVKINDFARENSSLEGIVAFGILTAVVVTAHFIIRIFLINVSINRLANKQTENKKFDFLISSAIVSCPLIYTFLLMVYFPIGYCFYFTGAIYNIGIIFIIIMQIALLKSYVRLKKEQKERMKSSPQYIGENNEINEVNELLKKCGKNFFIKYYMFLKNWETADILDEIQESYEDSTKLLKIDAGKKIFLKNLNVVSLKIIVNSPDETLKKEIKEKANQILQNELSKGANEDERKG